MTHWATRPGSGYAFAIVTLLIWAGFVVVSRQAGIGVLTPYDVAALRVASAALVLSPWWLPRLLHPSRRRLPWRQTLTLALLAGIGYPLVAYTGLRLAPANHGAVLISGMLPFFTSLLALWLLAERPGLVRLGGLLLILAGVGILLSGSLTGGSLRGDLVLLLASFIWSTFTVLLKYWQVRAFDVTLGVSAVAACVYLPVYTLFLPNHLTQASWHEIALQAVFQGLVVMGIATWTYAKAVELLGSVKVVIITASVPVVGSLMAVAFLGEPLTTCVVLGAVATFLGAVIGSAAKSYRMAR